MQSVAVTGASNKPDRYSCKAVKMLLEKGCNVFPVHPVIKEIEGNKVYASLSEIKEKIDTITMYVNAVTSADMAADILKIKPKRVIFNPGAENTVLAEQLRSAGIEVLCACTLVLLSTGQF